MAAFSPTTENSSKSFKRTISLQYRPEQLINVFINSLTGVQVEYKGVIYDTEIFSKPKNLLLIPLRRRKNTYRPPEDHYYKYGRNLVKPIVYDESDQKF